jgi:hypothetical protein
MVDTVVLQTSPLREETDTDGAKGKGRRAGEGPEAMTTDTLLNSEANAEAGDD